MDPTPAPDPSSPPFPPADVPTRPRSALGGAARDLAEPSRAAAPTTAARAAAALMFSPPRALPQDHAPLERPPLVEGAPLEQRAALAHPAPARAPFPPRATLGAAIAALALSFVARPNPFPVRSTSPITLRHAPRKSLGTGTLVARVANAAQHCAAVDALSLSTSSMNLSTGMGKGGRSWSPMLAAGVHRPVAFRFLSDLVSRPPPKFLQCLKSHPTCGPGESTRTAEGDG